MRRVPRTVRPATRADLESLLALEEATFDSDRISRRQWRRHLASSSARVLVCGAAGDVTAAVVVFFRRNTHHARLYSLAVRADQRGAGLGRLLLAAAESAARARGCHSMGLEVHTHNHAAISLYARFGYAPVARLRRFYEDGADAWRYAKSLIAT